MSEFPHISKLKRRHGLLWDPVKFPSDFAIDLNLWKKHREPEFRGHTCPAPHELFIERMKQVLTNDEWSVSKWTEQHCFDFTTEDYLVVWGCAGSSKSNDFGLLLLLDWIVDPNHTIAMLASTTKPALLKRSFESVARYQRILRSKGLGFPGRLDKTGMAIVLDDSESDGYGSLKTRIQGIALRDGPVSDAVGHIRGAHAPYVRLLADELSALHPAVADPALLTNLKVGAKSFKFVALTNIDSFTDLAGRNSVPVDGWSSVSPDVHYWRTAKGIVRRHDGFLSPAIIEPGGKERYPHLLNQDTLDEIIRGENGNLDSPAIWHMIRAWPPPQNLESTVLTEQEAIRWKMAEPVLWKTAPRLVAGLDPGFGGDKAVLRILEVGTAVDGAIVANFMPPHILKIEASSPDPVTYQLTNQTIEILAALNIPASRLAVDDSGTQSVADVLSKEWMSGCIRVSFGSKASDMPVSVFNAMQAREKYANLATEIVYAFREFGTFLQIRGLDETTLGQITKRRVSGKPLKLESKADYKKRTAANSPDEMDASALALHAARVALGLLPGASDFRPQGATKFQDPMLEQQWGSLAAKFNGMKCTYSGNIR